MRLFESAQVIEMPKVLRSSLSVISERQSEESVIPVPQKRRTMAEIIRDKEAPADLTQDVFSEDLNPLFSKTDQLVLARISAQPTLQVKDAVALIEKEPGK